MNKFTSTLAGLAVAATVSVAPAFAQGSLSSPPGAFTFSFPTATTFLASGTSVGFNPAGGGGSTTASFDLAGTLIAPLTYSVTSLSFTPAGGSLFTETSPLFFTVVATPGGTSIASVGAAPDGTNFTLVQAVPEASTVVSFGALLALGGLAVLRRKSVKNVA